VLENGGPYPHAGIWVAMARAELGDARRAWEVWRWISPIAHGASPATDPALANQATSPTADTCVSLALARNRQSPQDSQSVVISSWTASIQ